jgi:hypothetical protein
MEKLEAGKAKRTATKAKEDQMRKEPPNWQKLWRRRRESPPTALRKQSVENEKEARAAQAAQRKKDRDIKLAESMK